MSTRLPAKTSIRVNAIIESTLNHLQEAKEDVYPAPLANSAITSFVNSLAHSLLTDEQQQQVKIILELWKTCRYTQNGCGSGEELQSGKVADFVGPPL